MRSSQLIGKMVGSPQLRETATGTPVLNFDLLVVERKGESWEKHTFRVACFGEAAKRVTQQAKDGSELVCLCRIESREYTDKSGRTRKCEDHVANWVRVCMPEEAANAAT